MPKVLNYEADIKGGANVRTKLIIPVLASDPSGGALVEGLVWFNSTTNLLKYYDGTGVIGLGAVGGLDTEGIQDTVGAMVADTATVDWTYNDGTGALTAAVLDSPTLGGSSKAQVINDAVSAIVDGAPAALDTLNELAAALADDAAFSSTVTTALGLRVQSYTTTFGDAAATSFTITHNLNTRAVQVQIYQAATPWAQEDCEVAATTVNTVTLSGFATAPASAYYRVVVQGVPGV
jgi:hypothetical protein